jgi:hypothetical protein
MPTAPQVELARLALPMLYAVMGISIGTLAGASIALTTQPTGNSMVYYSPTPDNPPSNSNVTEAAAVPVVNSAPVQSLVDSAPVQSVVNSAPVQSFVNSAPAPIQNALSAALVRTSADAAMPSFTIGRSATTRADSGITHSHHEVKAGHRPASELAPFKIPTVERNTELRIAPENRTDRPVAHPVTKPVRKVLASAPLVLPGSFGGQPNFGDNPVVSTFYTEGDLQVAAYDASTGTIQSSDGRTFAVGPTVSLSTAIPWSDYQGDVHYRCAADGSCTLIRPGVVASNARLI